MSGDRTGDLVALDDAMNALARLDPRKVQIIEMRFSGGLSVEETAEVLKVFANRNGWADRVTCIRAFIGGRTEVQARIEDMPDYAGALSIAQEQLISRYGLTHIDFPLAQAEMTHADPGRQTTRSSEVA